MIQQIEAGDLHEVRRQLTFIEDPAQRITEMLKRGMREDACEALRAALDTPPVYFQDTSRCEHAGEIVAPRQPRKRKERDGEQPKRERPRGFKVCIGHAASGRTDYPAITFEPEAIGRAMGWSSEELLAFMAEVFRRAISVDPRNLRNAIASWAGPWETGATERAMVRHIPKDHPLRQEVERWILRSWFFCEGLSTHFNEKGLQRLLGVRIPDRHHHHNAYWFHAMPADYERECAIAEALTDRLRALGMSDDEIREDFFKWLEHFLAMGLNPGLIIGVANARIIAWPEQVRDRRNAIMAGTWDRVTKMDWLFDGHALLHPFIIARFLDAGACDTTEGLELARAQFRKKAARRLSEGKIGAVASVLAHLGHRLFGLTDENRFSLRQDERKVAFDLSECAAEAFDLAWRAGEHGICAALVNQFGEDACLDTQALRTRAKELLKQEGDGEGLKAKHAELVEERRTQIRTVADLARTTGKPIRLDYTPVFATRM